jgi:tetratricopeptide (TPR) repeat protein
MDTRNLLRERLRLSRDWVAAIDEIEKELEASGSKLEQSERLYELASIVEDVIPERERALGLYQRAWKLYPDNLKALSRAREVYGEIGRLEMVAKLGEMELRSPLAPTNLAQIVGEALLDCGHKDKALPVLERAIERTPESVRVQDALLALEYDPEFWTDAVELILDKVDRADDALATRMLLRAARIVRFEAPDDPRLEEILKRVLAKDIEEPSANFMYETLLSSANRWDELEAHHRSRAERAPDHGKKVEALRTFALEWVQRFKDRDRGAKFFDEAMKATSSNGAIMKSPVAAFSLLCQVQGQRGEWLGLLDLADSVLGRLSDEEKLYIAIQAGQIAFDKANDIERARKYFAIAARIEPQNPSVQEFIEVVGLTPEGGGGPLLGATRPATTDAQPSAAGSLSMSVTFRRRTSPRRRPPE